MSGEPKDYVPVMRLAVELWPTPEVTPESFLLDCQVLADGKRTPRELTAALREMRRLRTEPHRPNPAEMLQAARPFRAYYHAPFDVQELEAPRADPAVALRAIAEARAAAAAARKDTP